VGGEFYDTGFLRSPDPDWLLCLELWDSLKLGFKMDLFSLPGWIVEGIKVIERVYKQVQAEAIRDAG